MLGEHGTVEIGGFAVNEMRTWNFTEPAAEATTKSWRNISVNPPNVYGFGHQAYYEHVVDCIVNGRTQLWTASRAAGASSSSPRSTNRSKPGAQSICRFQPQRCRLGRRNE